MGKWERSAEKWDAICLLVGKTTPQEPKSGGESQKQGPEGYKKSAEASVDPSADDTVPGGGFSPSLSGRESEPYASS